ncbi:MAG: nucleoside deaminase [Oscillospiraceae bacterium]
MAEKTLVITYNEDPEYRLSDLKPHEVKLLQRVIEICQEARDGGNHPFGCLLADDDGNILMEQGNGEVSLNGDCSAHAETLLMRKASQVYSKEEMAKLTMYNCAEPCAMCSGAMYWGNLGRMVYIGRESALKEVTGDDIRNPTLDLPCRAVFARGQKNMVVQGPYLEMEPDFLKCHENYWNPST